jgi:peptide/nickel transport system substrate-binding protein
LENFKHNSNKKLQMTTSRTISKLSGFIFLAILLACISCGGESTGDEGQNVKKSSIPDGFVVRVHLNSNTSGLNALLAGTAVASEILDPNVHCRLLETDPDDFGPRPYLAVGRPEIKILETGGMAISYEIREEAVWDNGTPISAYDYAFTLKVIKNPKSDAASLRPWVEFVEDVVIDDHNPKKFTVICSKTYLLAEHVTGALPVFPAYFYDPQGLMSDFTLPELNSKTNIDRLKADPRIRDFAEVFNEKYNHEPDMIVGGGPYQITEVATHQHIKLTRKKEWWGDKVDVDYIAAYPEKIHFKIIDDDNNAILSLKEQELDVMSHIPEDHFLELEGNTRATDNFHFYSPNSFDYKYIGINTKDPKLSDVRVRKAIAHLVDKQHVVDQLSSGLASAVNGPVSPLKTYCNKDVPELEFSIEKAKALLAQAGWTDTDGDNILDKVVAGQKLDLKLKTVYPQGKQFYKNLAQILKDEASRVGIEIDMIAVEGSVLFDDLKKRNFDLICLGWSRSPNLDDFKQIWHTSSDTYDGSNASGFGTEESDQLIDDIRTTIDEAKRNEMYMRFQEIIGEEQPYIFLVAPKQCIAINKRFTDAPASSLRPGYWVRLFKLAEN